MTAIGEPQLAAPGAGLPAPELFVAKKLFWLKCRSESREGFIEEFKNEQKLIRELIVACPAERHGEPVLVPRLRGMEDSSRFWSVWMTLDHLRIVNTGLGGFITELSQEKQIEGALGTADVKPDPEVTASVVAEYEQACGDFLSNVAAAKNLDTIATYPHPWFGPMNAFRWLALASLHMGIHRKQIAAIIGGLDS